MGKKAVLFDLYGTLVRRNRIEEDPLEPALRSVYRFLQSEGCKADVERFKDIDQQVFTQQLDRRKSTLREIDLHTAYKEILPEVGVQASDHIINECISAFGKPFEDRIWELHQSHVLNYGYYLLDYLFWRGCRVVAVDIL